MLYRVKIWNATAHHLSVMQDVLCTRQGWNLFEYKEIPADLITFLQKHQLKYKLEEIPQSLEEISNSPESVDEKSSSAEESMADATSLESEKETPRDLSTPETEVSVPQVTLTPVDSLNTETENTPEMEVVSEDLPMSETEKGTDQSFKKWNS